MLFSLGRVGNGLFNAVKRQSGRLLGSQPDLIEPEDGVKHTASQNSQIYWNEFENSSAEFYAIEDPVLVESGHQATDLDDQDDEPPSDHDAMLIDTDEGENEIADREPL